jgi:hypothetical protein
MKTLAILLVMASFLCGSFLAVLDPTTLNWTLMVPVLAVGVLGLFLYRKVVHSESRSGDLLTGNIENLGKNLDNILANLEDIQARGEEIPTYEARFEIDRLFREDLDSFAEARESMMHVFGMQNYADVMSNFAAGERYINRVWSASTDGYVDEVRLYLKKARDQFREAHEHFHELKNRFAQDKAIHQGV